MPTAFDAGFFRDQAGVQPDGFGFDLAVSEATFAVRAGQLPRPGKAIGSGVTGRPVIARRSASFRTLILSEFPNRVRFSNLFAVPFALGIVGAEWLAPMQVLSNPPRRRFGSCERGFQSVRFPARVLGLNRQLGQP